MPRYQVNDGYLKMMLFEKIYEIEAADEQEAIELCRSGRFIPISEQCVEEAHESIDDPDVMELVND